MQTVINVAYCATSYDLAVQAAEVGRVPFLSYFRVEICVPLLALIFIPSTTKFTNQISVPSHKHYRMYNVSSSVSSDFMALFITNAVIMIIIMIRNSNDSPWSYCHNDIHKLHTTPQQQLQAHSMMVCIITQFCTLGGFAIWPHDNTIHNRALGPAIGSLILIPA